MRPLTMFWVIIDEPTLIVSNTTELITKAVPAATAIRPWTDFKPTALIFSFVIFISTPCFKYPRLRNRYPRYCYTVLHTLLFNSVALTLETKTI
ncbi:hypothetical protein [Aquitalea sp. USM4]|uniref:hypothetical protein n=1 Tax=Aquitalea sp. USM4 TaxID=1590041 RepID=UPI001A9550B7|nr:hypothetical protein [Aquitalea sp. USM4]